MYVTDNDYYDKVCTFAVVSPTKPVEIVLKSSDTTIFVKP